MSFWVVYTCVFSVWWLLEKLTMSRSFNFALPWNIEKRMRWRWIHHYYLSHRRNCVISETADGVVEVTEPRKRKNKLGKTFASPVNNKFRFCWANLWFTSLGSLNCPYHTQTCKARFSQCKQTKTTFLVGHNLLTRAIADTTFQPNCFGGKKTIQLNYHFAARFSLLEAKNTFLVYWIRYWSYTRVTDRAFLFL